mgnify:CR=1 FL=1
MEQKKNSFITRMLNRVKEEISLRRERMEALKSEALRKECAQELQVMEWDGGLYICHHGIPLIKEDLLDNALEKAVAEGRKTLQAWKEERR